MAKKLDDCDVRLPSQFLTDDELLMDFKSNSIGPGFNPIETHSDLSSPVESVIASVDTESDDEECINGLTFKMAHSTLHENSGFGYGNTKGWSLSCSPQSTLCGCKQGSSDGAFDQFYVASGEVARIRMTEEAAGLYQMKTGLWATADKTSTVRVAPKYSYQQLQVAQFGRLKQQQVMKQSKGVSRSVKGGYGQYTMNHNQQKLAHSRGQSGVISPMNSSVSGWPSLQQSQFQQQPGSGMRAVFLGSPGPKREFTGTGVFLPRRIGTQTETRKKPGCSAVLLPDRVVHALNLNLEAMEARRYQVGSGLTPSSGSIYPNNVALAQQRRNLRTGNTYSQPATMSQELFLPQDWTY
ncbi:unnamed protein product [Withania somnifera]